jgi:hypothetical protein
LRADFPLSFPAEFLREQSLRYRNCGVLRTAASARREKWAHGDTVRREKWAHGDTAFH